MIPRVYILWLILLVIKTYAVLYNMIALSIDYKKRGYEWKFKFWFVFAESKILCEESNKSLHLNWDKIYNKEYYLDYLIFCDNLDWFFSDYVTDLSPYNLYDIFEVFFYSEDRRL